MRKTISGLILALVAALSGCETLSDSKDVYCLLTEEERAAVRARAGIQYQWVTCED